MKDWDEKEKQKTIRRLNELKKILKKLIKNEKVGFEIIDDWKKLIYDNLQSQKNLKVGMYKAQENLETITRDKNMLKSIIEDLEKSLNNSMRNNE